MMTYIVEDRNLNVINYFHRLIDAKRFVIRNFEEGLTIMSMKGQYFGEGFHKYRYFLQPNLTFKREYIGM